ncbi:MAG: 3-keto-5-aminohexanoate cleavage protein [Actinobacteria bacterium]|nr:3-keto-5-aminohexanoate cleavage protein [Actinomycetota bacterium]
MDKLIITVTVDSSMSYPDNPFCHSIEDVKWFADEYIRAVNAGASICHVHGVHWLEDEVQPDGRKLSKIDFNGWQELHDRIKDKCNPIMQYGIASARMSDKIKLMNQKPDLMSYCFNSHDEYFQPDPSKPPKEIYALHPRGELKTFLQSCLDKGVKPECECFHTGAFFNVSAFQEEGLIKDKAWLTLFVSWPGGSWTPPTPKALINLVDHLPKNSNFNVSVMDYNPGLDWQILTVAIILGGHVRVGFEDNPFLEKGLYAKTNAELVEKIVTISKLLGREIASPDEAREIIGLRN